MITLSLVHVCLVCRCCALDGASFKIYISQGSVAMCLGCGEIFSDFFYHKLSEKCASKRILEIDQ